MLIPGDQSQESKPGSPMGCGIWVMDLLDRSGHLAHQDCWVCCHAGVLPLVLFPQHLSGSFEIKLHECYRLQPLAEPRSQMTWNNKSAWICSWEVSSSHCSAFPPNGTWRDLSTAWYSCSCIGRYWSWEIWNVSQRGQNGTLCPSEDWTGQREQQETKGGELPLTGIRGVWTPPPQGEVKVLIQVPCDQKPPHCKCCPGCCSTCFSLH